MTITKNWKTYLAVTVTPLFLMACVTANEAQQDTQSTSENTTIDEDDPNTSNATALQISIANADWRSCENGDSAAPISNPSTLPVQDLYVYDVDGSNMDMDGTTAPKSDTLGQLSQLPPAPIDEPMVVIINGEEVLLASDYPFMVQLRVDLTDGFSLLRGQCGGTLISDQWIMTAAHCVDVQFGQDRYNSSLPQGSAGVTLDLHEVSIGMGHTTISAMEPSRITAKKALCHSGYNTTGNLENDIALIRLDTPIDVTSNPNIGVANLPGQGADVLDTAGEVMLKPMGYGKTQSGSTSQELMIVSLNLDPSETQPSLFTALQFNATAGICSGDSGGPIIKDLGGVEVLGLSSFVRTPNPNSCNFPEVPSSFTRVAYYRESMDAAIAACTYDDSCF